MHWLARRLLELAAESGLDFLARELKAPDRWEADPRTRTIRRRNSHVDVTPVEVGTVEVKGRATEVIINLCPRCGRALFVHGPGRRCPVDSSP